MLSFRRIALSCRSQGLSLWTARICLGNSDLRGDPEKYIVDQERSFHRLLLSRSYRKVCKLSSQAGAERGGVEDDDLKNGFSELYTLDGLGKDVISKDDDQDEDGTSKPEVPEEDDASQELIHDLEALGDGEDAGEKKSSRKWVTSALTKAIFAAPAHSVSSVLDKWVEEGNEVTQSDVSSTMLDLRNRRMFFRALQLSEWLESRKLLEFSESIYASRVDLIAKTRGIRAAEEYMMHIPESFKAEVYLTLLANCVSSGNVKKSEEVFQKMRGLISPITCSACDQMLILYSRFDKKKIASVLVLMDEEQVKRSVDTYQILINMRGQAKDIHGMEQIVEAMESEGIKPNTVIQASLARYYAAGGLKDQAEKLLNEIEGEELMKHRWDCCLLLPIYALIGRDDKVEKIWKMCEPDARLNECLAAIEAWGQLNKVENAEAVFEKMLKKLKRPPSKLVSALLNVYVKHKMVVKGDDLMKRVVDMDEKIGPLELDGLVKLYIGVGEVERAKLVIEKAAKERRGRPFLSTLILMMDKYAQGGDIHNAEKMFLMTKQVGYPSRIRHYQLLLDAHINAKTPVYGLMDRMRGDNIYPNSVMASQLAKVDPFRKSFVADLLE